MSSSDYREINNALNNYYGNKMNLYEEGSEYREEYRQKMKEQKKLVKELSIKAEAFDRIVEELKITEFDIYEKELVDERRGHLSFGREISRFLNEYESGGSDD